MDFSSQQLGNDEMLSKIRRIFEEKEPDFVEEIDKLKDCRIEHIDAGFVNILNREAMFVAYIDHYTPNTLTGHDELGTCSFYINMSLEEMERLQKEFEQECRA